MDPDQPTWLLGCPKKGHFKGKFFFVIGNFDIAWMFQNIVPK